MNAALHLPAIAIVQNALEPFGPQAGRIAGFWWLIFWVCTAVFVLVIGFLAISLIRRATASALMPAADPPDTPARKRRLGIGIGIAVAATVITLFVLLFESISTGRGIAALQAANPPSIEVTGYQWWWKIRYEDANANKEVVTANEIHIPVGQPVLLKLIARDVIHSLWIPSLHGKTDLIPGQDNTLWIRADRPGVYRGQCAEFCGLEHAKMGLLVIAEPPQQFTAWLESQRQPGREPSNDLERKGQDVFVSGPCAMCHRIAGTQANGQVAPDLTHLASRQTLGAATIPNTTGHLGGWIVDSQSIKPGNNMPPNSLSGADLQALLAYLRSLK